MRVLLLGHENDGTFLQKLGLSLQSYSNIEWLHYDSSLSSCTTYVSRTYSNFVTIKPFLSEWLSNKPDNINEIVAYEQALIEEESFPSKTFWQILLSEPTLFDIHHERKPYYNFPPTVDERIAYASSLHLIARRKGRA